MTRDELRRLAIRLARRPVPGLEQEHGVECRVCSRGIDIDHPDGPLSHVGYGTESCPIAELEAEEAASKVRPVEPKRNPDNCGPDIIHREY